MLLAYTQVSDFENKTELSQNSSVGKKYYSSG
jgi:hypothetical protein